MRFITSGGVSQANTLGGMLDSIQKRGFGGNRDNLIMRNGYKLAQLKTLARQLKPLKL